MGRGSRLTNPLLAPVPKSVSAEMLLKELAESDLDGIGGSLRALREGRTDPELRARGAGVLAKRLLAAGGAEDLLGELSPAARRALGERLLGACAEHGSAVRSAEALPLLLAVWLDCDAKLAGRCGSLRAWAWERISESIHGEPPDGYLQELRRLSEGGGRAAERVCERIVAETLESFGGVLERWVAKVAEGFGLKERPALPSPRRVVAGACDTLASRRGLSPAQRKLMQLDGERGHLRGAVYSCYRGALDGEAARRICAERGGVRQATRWILEHHPELSEGRLHDLCAQAGIEPLTVAVARSAGDVRECARQLAILLSPAR